MFWFFVPISCLEKTFLFLWWWFSFLRFCLEQKILFIWDDSLFESVDSNIWYFSCDVDPLCGFLTCNFSNDDDSLFGFLVWKRWYFSSIGDLLLGFLAWNSRLFSSDDDSLFGYLASNRWFSSLMMILFSEILSGGNDYFPLRWFSVGIISRKLFYRIRPKGLNPLKFGT